MNSFDVVSTPTAAKMAASTKARKKADPEGKTVVLYLLDSGMANYPHVPVGRTDRTDTETRYPQTTEVIPWGEPTGVWG